MPSQQPPPLSAAPVIPYASPMMIQSSDVWSEGKTIVARQNAVLPGRCVKCNAPTENAPMKRVYYWHHPGFYALILTGLLIYVIVALVVRKKGTVYIHVCPKHRNQRLIGMLVGWIGGLGGVILLIAGAANSSGPLAIVGLLLLIGGIVGGFAARLVYPKKIDDHFVWLAGANIQFVQSLDPVPGQSAPVQVAM